MEKKTKTMIKHSVLNKLIKSQDLKLSRKAFELFEANLKAVLVVALGFAKAQNPRSKVLKMKHVEQAFKLVFNKLDINTVDMVGDGADKCEEKLA